MSAGILDDTFNLLQKNGFKEIALELNQGRVEQTRYSSNSKDLYNNWDEESLSVFAS